MRRIAKTELHLLSPQIVIYINYGHITLRTPSVDGTLFIDFIPLDINQNHCTFLGQIMPYYLHTPFTKKDHILIDIELGSQLQLYMCPHGENPDDSTWFQNNRYPYLAHTEIDVSLFVENAPIMSADGLYVKQSMYVGAYSKYFHLNN